jgi:translation elongation factor P/translation initiation factor 5A
MATTNDIKNGSVLNLDGQLWAVVEFQHVKPGKGGAFVRTKMKNVRSGKVVDKTFNAGTKIDFATVDRRDYSFLYEDGNDYVFMDQTDFDQVTVPGVIVMVPASTVMASGACRSSGMVIQTDFRSRFGLNRMISAICTLATTISQSTTRIYSMILRGCLMRGFPGQ